MKSKDRIVERLLENKHITTEEAIILLKENQIGFKQFPVNITPATGKVPYHTICGCDVCHCVMGNKLVDPERSQKSNIHTTSSTDINGGINGNGESQQEYFGKK